MIVLKNLRKPKIIFDGNSLTNQGSGLIAGQQRYPLTCYNSIVSANKKISYFNFGVGSRRTTALTNEFAEKILPSANENDIIVFWEITNEAHDFISDTDGEQLYTNVVTYCNQVRDYGLKAVCLTGIARLMDGYDDVNITARIMACNTHLRNNASSFCDLLIDVGGLPEFDTQADTDNTTYYNADGTHLTNTGYDLIGTTVYNALTQIL